MLSLLLSWATAYRVAAQSLINDSDVMMMQDIRYLKIGDTIPQALWDLPLQIVGHSSAAKKITLRDYRDKSMIILDFWATWCSSCIAAFPGLYKLEEDLNHQVKVLSVTYQGQAAIQKFINKSEFIQSSRLKNTFSSIVSDSVLTKYFEKDAIPFTVCIDSRGVVRSLSMPSELSSTDLRTMMKDQHAVPVAAKVLEFDKPLLQPYYDAKIRNYYYSALLPYGRGISQASIFKVDSAQMIKHLVVPNLNVFMQYGAALQTHTDYVAGLSKIPSRRILEINNPSHFISKLDSNKNFAEYTYESVNPISLSDNDIYKKMESDLNLYLGMEGSYQQRNVDCLVIRIADPKKLMMSKSSSKVPTVILNGLVDSDGTSDGKFLQKADIRKEGAKNAMLNMEIGNIPNLFNRRSIAVLPFMIDETGLNGKVDIRLPDDLNDLGQLQHKFAEQGLDLSLERRELVMFVLTQNGFRKGSTDLELTSYGFIVNSKKEDTL